MINALQKFWQIILKKESRQMYSHIKEIPKKTQAPQTLTKWENILWRINQLE